jgi:hypothetical protein
MQKINYVRVVLAGLLAGLVVNLGEFVLNQLIMGQEWEAAMLSLNRSPFGTGTILWLVVMSFALGIVMIWIYAGLCPRFGAGWRTAIITGLVTWLLAYVLAFGWSYGMGVYSASIYFGTMVWTLFELPLAAVAGAWAYDRGSAALRKGS